jgi:hypothetical protein
MNALRGGLDEDEASREQCLHLARAWQPFEEAVVREMASGTAFMSAGEAAGRCCGCWCL